MALKVVGNAISFNGSNQSATRSASGSTANDDFTMACWVYNVANGAGTGCFFSNAATDARGQSLRITSAGVFNTDYHFVTNLSSGYTLTAGTWFHVALIRSAGTSQLYVNAGAQGGTSGSAPNSGTDYICLGCSSTSGGVFGEYFNGYVDDARYYERPISTTELTALYNRGLYGSPYEDISSANLKYWYKLDEGSGNPADSSGSGLTLTNNNTSPYVAGIYVQKSITVYHNNLNINGGRIGRPRPFSPGNAG